MFIEHLLNDEHQRTLNHAENLRLNAEQKNDGSNLIQWSCFSFGGP